MKSWVKLGLLLLGVTRATEKDADDDDREPGDDIEHVNDIDELQRMINKNKYLMAYFFHPNCFPCMDFVPEFDTLPDKVKELDWAENVEFVKVNMGGNENEIGAKYGVKGYPWINFYRNGKAIQFKGRRHVPKLISFMFQRIQQPFKLISSRAEAKTLVSGGSTDVEVILVAYFEANDAAFDIVESLSDDYYRVTFVRITDPEVAKSINLSKEGIAVMRPAIPEVVNYLPGKVTKEAMISFLEDYATPLIIDYNEDTQMLIFDDKQRYHSMLFMPDP